MSGQHAMRSTKESAVIVQANGHESVAESVDGSAPGDSLAALKLADLQLQTHGRRALRQEWSSATTVPAREAVLFTQQRGA